MKQRLLIIVSDTHAHILPEGACNLPIKSAKKDARASINCLPYLGCFKREGAVWDVEEHFVDPENIGVNYNNAHSFNFCKRWKIDKLRQQGYTVV